MEIMLELNWIWDKSLAGTYDAVSITLPPLRTGILPKSKKDIFLGQQSS